jgi:hypothetical protein
MIFMAKLFVGSVGKGNPVAQHYGYMESSGLESYKCDLCPDPDRAYRRGGKHSKTNYAVGPPWMLHIDDLRTVAPTWVALVPTLKAISGAWIVEMVAYAVACAYHELPHDLIHYGMVDNVRQHPLWLDNTNALRSEWDGHPVSLLHYCYTWELGERTPSTPAEGAAQHDRMVHRERTQKAPVIDYYHWSKYRVPSDWPGGKGNYLHNVMDCNCPLFQEFHTTNALHSSADKQMADNWVRTAVFLRRALPMLNEVLTIWKLSVLNCTVPSPEEEEQFESAIDDFHKRRGPDPTAQRAPEKFKRIINLSPQLRTSHPTYWTSNYVITKYNEDLKSVEVSDPKAFRKKKNAELRNLMHPTP